MKRAGLILILAGLSLTGFSGCLSSRHAAGKDVVLLVTPLRVKPIEAGASLDAIEGMTPETLWPTAVAVFKVDRVLKGQFNRTRAGGPSEWQQLADHAKKKNVLGLLTLDTQDPDEMHDQEWVSVAVHNPFLAFGIREEDWMSPPEKKGKLYLKRVGETAGSFELVQYKTT